MTISEYSAHRQPAVLLALEAHGLLMPGTTCTTRLISCLSGRAPRRIREMTAAIEELRGDIIESGVRLEQAALATRVQSNRHADPTEAKGIRLLTNRPEGIAVG